MVHELKTWPEYYEKVISGEKTFEIRKDDRGFKTGDVLHLREWDQTTGAYTGQETVVKVVYLTAFGMEPGFLCMAIKPLYYKDQAAL